MINARYGATRRDAANKFNAPQRYNEQSASVRETHEIIDAFICRRNYARMSITADDSISHANASETRGRAMRSSIFNRI